MAAHTPISDLKNHIDQTVTIKGFVDTLRDQKKVQFLVIRDHTGHVQAVHVKNGSDQERVISSITPESSIEITGRVIAAPNVKLGGIEVSIEEIKLINLSESPLPLDENSGLDVRLNWRFLDLRRPENALIFKVQTLIECAMREFWHDHQFIEIHSPKLMGAASESGAELFKLEYFDRFAYLAQSPQFYKQMAIAAGFDKVFEIGPVFRANPSFTSRHDTEFTSVDMEIAWIDSHDDIMRLEEQWLVYVLTRVKEEYGEAIKQTYHIDVNIPAVPFPKMTMTEAHRILAGLGHNLPANTDLDSEGEKLLAQYVFDKYGHEFVFVTDYPSLVRPFYHMRYAENPAQTKSFDLLWKGLELTSGAQREHRYNILVQQALEKGLALEPIKTYLDCFRYGCPPHGGLGFGLSRMIMLLLGFKNVREVTYLYRGPNRLSP
jgi:aspartyl-tRNA synthetase